MLTSFDQQSGPGPQGRPRRRGRPLSPGASDAILDATIALAAEVGFEALTMDAIAARARVGRPTIYRRWPSKEALIESAVTRIIEGLRHPNTGDIRSELVLHVVEMINSIQSTAGTAYLAYTFEPQWAGLGAAAQAQCRERNRETIRRAVERGQIRADADPDLLLDLLTGIVWLRGHVHHEHLDAEDAAVIVDAVLPSFLAREGSGAADGSAQDAGEHRQVHAASPAKGRGAGPGRSASGPRGAA